jgi:hypothetical protein
MNQTPAARQILTLLLSGLYATEDDRTSAMTVIEGLAQHPSPENDELLFRVLVTPEQLRPAGRGEVTAAELRDKAIAVLAAGGDSAFRVKLAAYLAKEGVTNESRAKLLPLLRDSSPANLEAQAVLYRGGHAPADFLAQAEKGFAVSSSDALDLLASTPRARSLKVDAAWAPRAAAQIWSREFLASLIQRLRQAETFRGGSPPVLLASTTPNDVVRAALYESLRRNWEEGPSGLLAAGLGTRVLSEPGFAVLVKLLYRREASGLNGLSEGQPAKARTLMAKRVLAAKRYADWIRPLEKQLTSRLSQGGAQGGAGDGDQRTDANLPVQIDSPRDVMVRYDLDWQPAMRDTLVGIPLDPLAVHYVKIEERAHPSRVVLFYRRQLRFGDQLKTNNGPKGFEVHQSAQEIWFDGATIGSTPDRARSLDVIIRPANPDLPAMHDEERKMIVEILAIEINDPARGRELGSN